MINGEGSLENDVVSPDSFDTRSDDVGGGNDESPGSSSRYSSCGESELERYCSANSVMGTPSLCSSSVGVVNDSFGSEFGSLENFSLEGRFDRDLVEERKLSDSGTECLNSGVEGRFITNGSGGNAELEASVEREDVVVDDNLNSSDFGVPVVEMVREDDCGGAGSSRLSFDGRDVDGEEDGMSSTYEHSEGDDSMYGCGSDDENQNNSFFRRILQNRKEAKVENESPLLINSSVAFGSEDWDDFEQQMGGGSLVSLSLDNLQEQGEQNIDTQGDLIDSTSLNKSTVPIVSQTEIGEDVIRQPAGIRQHEGDELADDFINCSAVPTAFQNTELAQVEDLRDIPEASCQIQGEHEFTQGDKTVPITLFSQGASDTTEYFNSDSLSDIFEIKQDPLVEETPMMLGLNMINYDMKMEGSCVKSEESTHVNDNKVLEHQEAQNLEVEVDLLSDKTKQISSCPSGHKTGAEFIGDQKSNSTQTIGENSTSKITEDNPAFGDLLDDNTKVVKAAKLELKEFYDEIVNEMEEILLDSGESPGSRFSQGNRLFHSQPSLPPRDGGPTASTSGTDITFPSITQPFKIDGVEVVGAKQKKGDVSLSERLVGVKEYTVYVMRVWSGKDQWEVERRYRDFFTLYRRLKSLFADQGWILPSPWASIEKESRKIFGNVSPDVISERSVLIQECLQSVLHSGFFSTPPSALIWFLCPQDSLFSSPTSKASVPQSIFSNIATNTEQNSTLGKTISLIVEIRPFKSMRQMLEAQHYTCAGCHKHFDDGITLVRDFVQILGWGKPRICEYTGQLFCSSCHTNETAVLPARVLHYWDFNKYPVSQLAKSYLDSIHEQPMLCVSAVNPFLFSKVPALHQVMNVRKKIGTMLPYVRCPFRRTINKGLGVRRYLLESNDFFALRDLVDLSKGPFSALPVMVETVSRKILEHITEQCLLCCDVGVPCSARQACNDPSSLIFPFQEGEIERCRSCELVFHKPCFRKLTSCSCGADLGADGPVNSLSRKASEYLLGKQSSSFLPGGLISGLFSRANPEKIKDNKDNDTVILMGSLPSTSL